MRADLSYPRPPLPPPSWYNAPWVDKHRGPPGRFTKGVFKFARDLAFPIPDLVNMARGKIKRGSPEADNLLMASVMGGGMRGMGGHMLRGPKGIPMTGDEASAAWQEHVFMAPGMAKHRDYILGPSLENMERVPANWKGGKVRREGSPMQRELNQRFEGVDEGMLRHEYVMDEANAGADHLDDLNLNPNDPNSLNRYLHFDRAHDHALEQWQGHFDKLVNPVHLDYARPRDPILNQTHPGHAKFLQKLERKNPKYRAQAKAANADDERSRAFGLDSRLGFGRKHVTWLPDYRIGTNTGPRYLFRKDSNIPDRTVSSKASKEHLRAIVRHRAGLRSDSHPVLWSRMRT